MERPRLPAHRVGAIADSLSATELPEVMLVHGLNDSEEALEKIAQALGKIQPDEVHINMPTRPPAEAWVKPPQEAVLRHAVEVFGDIAKVVRPVNGIFDTSNGGDVTEAILTIITRHPMRESELRDMLKRWNSKHVETALIDLEANGKAQVVERHCSRFWSVAVARYAKI